MRDAGYYEDEDTAVNGIDNGNPAATAQINGTNPDDMEEGEVEDEEDGELQAVARVSEVATVSCFVETIPARVSRRNRQHQWMNPTSRNP